MLLMGDEVRRSQGGNNNAYCQDTEISWFDWSLVERHAEIQRFVKRMIAFRVNRELPVERLHMTLAELLRRQPLEWHGVRLNQPDWSETSHTVAATVRLLGYPLLLHLMINAYWEPLDFEVPPLAAGAAWRCCLDTFAEPPHDICYWTEAPRLSGPTCRVEPRSLVLLLANTDPVEADPTAP
jgi:glycogen operon protein